MTGKREWMDEKDLVTRAQAGCREALEQLVVRYQESLFSFLYRYVGQAADAEDLSQEVFMKALRNIDGFRRESSLGTWLFAIAANTARDWQRKKARRDGRHVTIADSGAMEVATSVREDPSQVAADGESARAVRDAVATLAARERAAVILRTYHGLGYGQVAQVIGCSRAAVGPLLYRARKHLEARLRFLTDAEPAKT